MAGGIEIPIGAPLGQLTSDLKGAQGKLKQSLSSMQTDLKFYEAIAKKSLDPSVVSLYNSKIQTTQLEIAKLANVGKTGFDEMGNAVGKNTNALRASFAFLLRWAYILPGIGVAGLLAFAIEPIGKFIGSLEVFNKKLSESKLGLMAMAEALKSNEYAEAVKNVQELTTNIELAQKGFISKEGVLKQYNETIGKTTGQVTSLDQAEKALTKNAPSYIQFTLLKAAAQIALSAAAEEAYKTALQTQTDEVRQAKFANSAIIAGDKEMIGLQKVLTKELKRESDLRLKNGQEAQQKQISIAKKFQEEAAKIAKQSGFNFFGDTKPEKAASSTKQERGVLPYITDLGLAHYAHDVANRTKKSLEATFANIQPADIEVSKLIPTGNLYTPFEIFKETIQYDILPQLQSSFTTFFDDILTKGKLSFESLGKAIINTFASVVASEASQSLVNLLGAKGGKSEGKGGGLIGGLLGLLGKGGGAAAGAGTAASGGLLLPILGGIAAGALIASLFKKKQAPVPAVATSVSSSSSGAGVQHLGDGRVVFEISGVNLIGVLNRAGASLARYKGG